MTQAHLPGPAGLNAAERPLHGLLVLDFSQFLAGPSCALRLADLGAEVIKIERPQGGDLARSLYLADQTFAGDSALFHTINRNKRSFSADLKNPTDLERVKALVRRADVMVHNFRPGVMDRLGLGYDTVSALNPRLVYAAITGYGSRGPWRGKPGQDLLVQAMSGLAWLTGDAGQGPVPFGVSIADLTAGAHLCQGILAMLVRRGSTGRGGRVDVSLFESAIDLQFEAFTAFLNGGRAQPARDETNSASVYLPAPYGIYQTADGYLALAMTAIKQLGELIGCAPLSRYDAPSNWFRERATIKAILAERLAKRTTAHWLAVLEPADIWCAEVFTWPELLAHEGFAALDLTQEIHDSGSGKMVTTRCPIRVDGQVLTSTRAAPTLGRDTDEILRTFDLDSPEAK
ncbi:MAG: L-carnitine dehydratase/bile acid-inducible protein [Gammaproteobacteria bacterium]|nr:L-carnitine dehydratase/bile acid-inducible protein [Gammaproteobacteria bacterium]